MKRLFNIVRAAFILTLFFGTLGCAKEVPPPAAPRDPGFNTYTLYGRVEDLQGNPMRGLEVKIITNFKSQSLRTDSNGEYQVTSFQGYSEPTRFEFINEIGDTAHFQTELSGHRNQRIDFVLDQRGSVAIKSVQ